MPDNVELHGLDELISQLQKLSLVGQKTILNKAVKAGADVIAEEAARNAPRDTGELAANIITKLIGRTNTVDQVIAEIGPEKSVFYGSFIETGTAHMAARPFLRPALEDKRDAALAESAAVIKEEIEKLTSIVPKR